MQNISSEHNDLADSEVLFLSGGDDFPTAEELLAALDASLEQVCWEPRTDPIGLDNASRDLAKSWHAIENPASSPPQFTNDDHYLVDMNESTAQQESLSIEPDFLIDFAKFLVRRLSTRMLEVQQVQHQLIKELAKLQP